MQSRLTQSTYLRYLLQDIGYSFRTLNALGAERLDIMGLVVSQALAPVIAGGIVGLGIATLCGYLAKAMLYEVSPADAISLAAAAILLSLTALAACVVPANQAVRVDPMIALASE
jgi:putative ABC transport system permease protein